ncbi:hypothetical protein [Bacillus sp. EB01]|uniref:hypothetical protein n=1 Tax=Bacillus sp. EB01 TaxID=1347086 RepID=UPI0005C49C4D|nr:hypothetical protein [Bacillus sp. EB01]
MTYELTAKEIGFLYVILEQPLPLFIDDPFADVTAEKLEEEWKFFCGSSFLKGFLKLNEEGNPYIADELMDQLAVILTAEQVISVVENDEVSKVLYIGEGTEKNIVIDIFENHYSLSLFGRREFLKELLGSVSTENSQVNEFHFDMVLSEFDRLVEVFYDEGAEGLFQQCEKLNLPSRSILSIIKAVNSPDCTVFLTESLRHRETAMTIVFNEAGTIKLVTSVYSGKGDRAILREAKVERLPQLLLIDVEKVKGEV